MIVTNTPSVEGKNITEHLGIVGAEALVMGGLTENTGKKFLAEMAAARKAAIEEVKARASGLGADAIVGFRIDHTAISTGVHTVLLMATGTAVRLA